MTNKDPVDPGGKEPGLGSSKDGRVDTNFLSSREKEWASQPQIPSPSTSARGAAVRELLERVQGLQQTFDNYQSSQPSSGASDDASAQRIRQMLSTVEDLEKQLQGNLGEAAASQPATTEMPGSSSTSKPVPKADQEQSEALARMEQQLKQIDQHLTQAGATDFLPSPDNPRSATGLKDNYDRGFDVASEGLSRARDGVHEVRANEVNHPVLPSSDNQRDIDEETRDAYFQKLMVEMERLHRGGFDPEAVDKLRLELSDLKHELKSSQSQNTLAGQAIRDEVKRLAAIVSQLRDDGSFSSLIPRMDLLEADISRIAEFLLKSPDLAGLSDSMQTIRQELTDISSVLLLIKKQEEQNATYQRDHLFAGLQSSLSGLRDDILLSIQQAGQPDEALYALVRELEQRLHAVQGELQSSLGDFRGDIYGLGNGLQSVETSLGEARQDIQGLGTGLQNVKVSLGDVRGDVSGLNTGLHAVETSLGGLRGDVHQLGTDLRQMDTSLAGVKNTVQGLDLGMNDVRASVQDMRADVQGVDGSLGQIRGEMNGLEAGLQGVASSVGEMKGSVHGLGSGLHGVETSIGEIRNEMQGVGASIVDLKEEMNGLGAGLKGQVQEVGAQFQSATKLLEAINRERESGPASMEKMKRMEGRLVRAAERLEMVSAEAAAWQSKSADLSVFEDVLTEKSLQTGLGTFAETIGSTLSHNHLNMISRIDDALSKLDQVSDNHAKMVEDVARRTSEQTVSQMPARDEGALISPDAHEPIIQANLEEIRAIGQALMDRNNAQFSSLNSQLTSVADRLHQLEQQERDLLKLTDLKALELQKSEQIAGADEADNTINDELRDLRDYLSVMKTSTDDLSAETRSSFHSVQTILERVTERLEILEGVGKADPAPEADKMQKSPILTPSAEHESDSMPPAVEQGLSDIHEDHDGQEIQGDQPDAHANQPQQAFEPLTTPSLNISHSPAQLSNADVMKRMRDHVRAIGSAPEQPLGPQQPVTEQAIQSPSARDELQKVAAHEKHEPDAAPHANLGKIPASISDVPDLEADQIRSSSQTDFVAAARRAAQAAAAEQSANIEADVAQPTNSFAAMRQRLKTRPNTQTAGSTTPQILSRDKLETEPPLVLGENARSPVQEGVGPDRDPVDSGSPKSSAVDTKDEKTNGKNIVYGGLVVAVIAIAILGYFLQDNIRGIIAGGSVDSPVSSPVDFAEPSDGSENGEDAEAARNPGEPSQLEASGEDDSTLNLAISPGATAYNEAVSIDSVATVSTEFSIGENKPKSAYEAVVDAVPTLPLGQVSDTLKQGLLAGDSEAMIEIARRFGEGDIFVRDMKKAAFWYERAAEHGSAIAKFRLGTLYEEGLGVAKDFAAAKKWYGHAAQAGNARAMHNLAVIYAEGALGRSDYKSAFEWFEKGANHGVRDSQFNLGILYVRGLGVQKDLLQAYKWFDIVAKGGDKGALAKRDDVAKVLSNDQLERAREESGQHVFKPVNKPANVLTKSPGHWASTQNFAARGPSAASDVQNEKLGSAAASSFDGNGSVGSSDEVKQVQLLLNDLGFDTGEPDGVFGKRTSEAIRAFENEVGLPQTGRISKSLIQILRSQNI